MQKPAIATRAIHHGDSFAEGTGTVMPPIYATSTFAHGNPGGFDYTRSGNPNFRILEAVLASVEQCAHATVFGSGVSAITAIASTLRQGDRVLCEENLYGCTVRLFEQVFAKFGVRTEWVDFTDATALATIAERKPAMVWLESPTNPLLKVIDLEAVCMAARSAGVPVVVDNTFATALVQRPLAMGATLSLTSTTKYINGHSDALGGAVCCDDPAWHQKMVFAQKALGLMPSPFDCWLITRGIKTLPLRLRQQMASAAAIADHLAAHPAVAWVRYPLRTDHPQHSVAQRQMQGGGAIVTLGLNANRDLAYAVSKALRWFTMAESLGGVESLICHPATMTHAAVSVDVKEKLGISDGLVRLSVGCEDTADLIADLDQALSLLP
ncbi:PLP-dependent transferase [Synechococcus sp. WH 8101]|uniref:trans-sulfuration enzyme family protein n=1 Tax=Synechococcus sp. WH 8101 TaxID=59932 RepID=UPI001022B132|nr:PLP-dependent aspartate aminotransferase family protein [Synechococcus sp. WH 8101]QBE68241.1 PLP-dependent transferase [Synechococcus sp. WH 8101]QNI44452.1 O-succinylhomoserine(thiol)-lyase [Synechococcus sp. WH 8101]